MKTGRLTLAGDNPMQIEEVVDQNISQLTGKQQETVEQVGRTVKAYRKAAEDLLQGKYAHLKDLAPAHLADPGDILVGCCLDGVVIRYDRKKDTTRVVAGWMSQGLPEVVSLLSQGLVQCYANTNYTSTIPTTGALLKMFRENALTRTREEVLSFRIGLDAVIRRPERLPQPPCKPYCLLSVRNIFEIGLLGEMLPNDKSAGDGQRFLARSFLRLPLGWECIELFPFFDLDQWTPENAPIWAENDLLGAVVARQFRDAHFESLDPNASARRHFAEVLKKYKNLLDSMPEREEILQTFLRDNPVLICPTKTRMWPKLALGARETDFVFREAERDYLLVELERSTHRLFIKSGHPSQVLNHARGQVTDWRRYLEDNLPTVQRELGLDGISANPRSIVVIGRSQSLTSENRRKLIAMENDSPRTKIMTYDDLYENAKAVIENLFGPLWEGTGNTKIYYLPRTES